MPLLFFLPKKMSIFFFLLVSSTSLFAHYWNKTSSISTGLLKMLKRLSVASLLVTSLRNNRNSLNVFSSWSSIRFFSDSDNWRGGDRKEKLEVTGKRTRRMSPSNSTCPTSSTWHFGLPNVLPPLVFCLIEEKCRFKVFLGHSVRPFKWKSRKAGDVAQW